MSSAAYASYLQTRSVLALPQASLLPIAPPSAGAFGLHSKFTELQALFNQKHLAVLTNVGTLVRPTTRAQFQQRQVTLPQNLSPTRIKRHKCRLPRSPATDRQDGPEERPTRSRPSMRKLPHHYFPGRIEYFLRGPIGSSDSVQR